MTSTRIDLYSRYETVFDRNQRTMTSTRTVNQPALDSEAYQLAEQLLRPRFQFLDVLALATAQTPAGEKVAQEHKRTKDAARLELMALSVDELRNRLKQQEAQAAAQHAAQVEATKRRKEEKAQREAQAAAAREAAKFYNLPSSAADFRYWATMDYWTFDETLALLMGLDPRVMTRSAMKKECEPGFELMFLPQSQPKKSGFVLRYEALRVVAERATALKPKQLRPVDVVLWAGNSGVITPPDELVQALLARVNRSQPQAPRTAEPQQIQQPPEVRVEQSPPNSTPLKRAALIQKHERAWPTIEADLRHSNENGLLACAKGDGHGYWLDEPAIEWARKNGKLRDAFGPSGHPAHAPFGTVHRIDG